MNITQYQKAAAASSSKTLDNNIGILVAGLGLAGEYYEFLATLNQYGTDEDAFLELGDVCWYVAELATRLNLQLNPNEPPCQPHEKAKTLYAITEHLKKSFGQGHDLNKPWLRQRLSSLINAFVDLGTIANLDILQSNINKLKCRYPEGFSTERSINREEKNEFFPARKSPVS